MREVGRTGRARTAELKEVVQEGRDWPSRGERHLVKQEAAVHREPSLSRI